MTYSEEWPIYYNDIGCKLALSCLNCPFPKCRYDEPRGIKKDKLLRNEEIIKLYQMGETIKDLSQKFGLTRMSIRNILKETRTKIWV